MGPLELRKERDKSLPVLNVGSRVPNRTFSPLPGSIFYPALVAQAVAVGVPVFPIDGIYLFQ